MKFNDELTMSIAASVSDVLEGKVKVKEEGKYPHDMFHPETGEKKVAKDEAEHNALADKGYTHEKNESPDEPKAKGEKDFKDKHKIKKSGENTDGTVTKESKEEDEDKEVEQEGNAFTKALNAARKNGDVNFVVSGKKYQVKEYEDKDDEEEVEEAASGPQVSKAVAIAKKSDGNMTKAVKEIEKMSKGLSDHPKVAAALKAANESVDEAHEEALKLNEGELPDALKKAIAKKKGEKDDVEEDQDGSKEKYKAFFQKALKKYGVKNPAELEKSKRAEFFNYVDKNYNSEDEPGKDGVK